MVLFIKNLLQAGVHAGSAERAFVYEGLPSRIRESSE
jgi:hypothetical protein